VKNEYDAAGRRHARGGGRPRDENGPKYQDAVRRDAKRLLAEDRANAVKNLTRIALTPDIIDGVVELVSQGNYPGSAAKSLGIPAGRLNEWMSVGREQFDQFQNMTEEQIAEHLASSADPEGLRLELFVRVSQVEGAWEVGFVKELVENSTDSYKWRGMSNVLERRLPELWGKREVRGASEDSFEANIKQILARTAKK
jgi:hypothetical protein